jgi:hypothetical protein
MALGARVAGNADHACFATWVAATRRTARLAVTAAGDAGVVGGAFQPGPADSVTAGLALTAAVLALPVLARAVLVPARGTVGDAGPADTAGPLCAAVVTAAIESRVTAGLADVFTCAADDALCARLGAHAAFATRLSPRAAGFVGPPRGATGSGTGAACGRRTAPGALSRAASGACSRVASRVFWRACLALGSSATVVFGLRSAAGAAGLLLGRGLAGGVRTTTDGCGRNDTRRKCK